MEFNQTNQNQGDVINSLEKKVKSKFKKGQKVFHFYSCEPSIIFGSGKSKEEGEVIGDPLEWNDKIWIPVVWQYGNGYPDLALEGSIQHEEEK